MSKLAITAETEADRYDTETHVKCYACHIMPPALNKNGYMFKRLGYRMPPDEMDGTKPAPKVRELSAQAKETHAIMNNCYRNYAVKNARQMASLIEE